MAFWVRKTTADLQPGWRVMLKGGEWEIVSVNGEDVTVRKNGITRTGRRSEWTARRPAVETPASVGSDAAHSGHVHMHADKPNLMTTQEYLRAVGMPDDELEGNARTFGTVLMRLYRERHGKTAKPAKKLEYVHYLDVNGMEAQRPNDDAPPHLRVRQNGWYESNAFVADDLDLMDRVREARHPSLPSLDAATASAMKTLMDMGAEVPAEWMKPGPAPSVAGARQVRWQVEEAVKKCLESGVICGHGECAKRRSRRGKVSQTQLEEMDWSV